MMIYKGSNIVSTLFKSSKLSQKIAFSFSQDQQNPANPEEGQKRIQELMKSYQNKDVQRTTIDEKAIHSKLKQRETKLPIRNYEISKDGTFYNPKQNVNPTKDVFNFSEDILKKKSAITQVYGLGNGYFSVNQVWYPGSLLIFPHQVFLWDVQTAADIRAHSLDLLEVIKPRPNYIIIGTGKDKFFLEEAIYDKFIKMKIRVDVLPTFEACSTYNVCAEDGMNICALLIPANL